MRNFVALFVTGIEIFKFNIINKLRKSSNRIILYLEGALIFPFNILQYFSLRRRCVSLQGKMQRLSEHNLVTLYLETLKFIADLLLLVTIPDTIPS